MELTDVLLLSEGGTARVGTPTVADARVVAEVLEHGRDKKVLVFKYKNKTRYRRRYGHRQDYTRLAIKQMGVGELAVAETKPKRTAKKKAEVEEAPEAIAELAIDTATATEAKPARRARKTAKAATPAAVAAADPSEEATAELVEPASPDAPEAAADDSPAEPEARE